MENKTKKLKQDVYRIAICSILVLIISIVITSIFITLIVVHNMKDTEQNIPYLWVGISVISCVVTIFALFSSVGGIIFLKTNKNWVEIDKVRKKSALDWGLFYFLVISKIEKYSDIENKKTDENNEK